MTAAALIDRLRGVQGRGPRWRAICPAHTSKHNTRTLSVQEEADGRVLVRCHAGCGFEDVLGAVGLGVDALFPERPLDHHKPRIKKPYRVADVVAALKGELHVAWIVLSDVKAKKPLTDEDAERAGVALERITLFIREIDDAR